MSTTEFNKLLREKDIVVMVADMLASTAFVPVQLGNSNKFTIHHYIEKAKKLISDLEKHNLKLQHAELN